MKSSDVNDDETVREDARRRARERLVRHPWPEPLLRTLERLRTDRRQAYLVGGTVRDVLLGRPSHDVYDVATDRVPHEVEGLFAHVVPIGIAHGTVLVVENDCRLEVTTMRREGEYRDARHPDRVVFTSDAVADLDRRDLTINAIAFDPESGTLLDPHGGGLDLERGILRAVGNPTDRFREDALRPLRVARFAAVLEMEPEPLTRAALGDVRDRARLLAVERVRAELERMMTAERPSIGFELLREASLLELWLPEIQRCYGVLQNRHHAWDVYDHSLHTVDAAPREKPHVRWAALLHDIGKPDTRAEKDGQGTFYNHEVVGAALAARVLDRLRFPNDERDAIVHLVREHMFDYRPEWTDATLRRWVRRVGVDAIADIFDLRIADYVGNGLRAGFPSYLESMRSRIEGLLAASSALQIKDLALDGRAVMRALEISPGPLVGEALEALLDHVLEHPENNTSERLIEAVRRWRREKDTSIA